MADQPIPALVLAASRGNLDPLAQAGGVRHKCFIDIAGQPMLRRVVERGAGERPRVNRTIVAIEPESIEEAKHDPRRRCPAPRRSNIVASRDNIGTSVAAVATPELLPLVITTGDNALHTAEMVAFFCDALDGVTEDGALGLTPADYVLDKYPEGNRAFHRFRDGAFSSCNLYAILTPKGLEAAQVFNSRRPVRQEAEAADRRLRPLRLPALQEPAVHAEHGAQGPLARHRRQDRAGADALRRRPDRRRPPGRLGPRQPHRRRAREARPSPRAPQYPPHCKFTRSHASHGKAQSRSPAAAERATRTSEPAS